MLKVTYRKKGIRLTHLWFLTNEEVDNIKKIKDCGDVLFLHGIDERKNVDGFLLSKQHTLIKDLTPTEEEIFQTFGKHLKQYINRNYRDNVDIVIYKNEEIIKNSQILDICKKLYEKMYLDKGMQSKFNKKLAIKYAKQNNLFILMANINNVSVGFCAIVYEGINSRWWMSAFDFRNEDNDSQILSRSHQRIIWDSMKESKKLGVKIFDFGGINSFEEPNGIAKFKLNFEKENKITYNNYLVSRTILGKLAVKIFKNKWS